MKRDAMSEPFLQLFVFLATYARSVEALNSFDSRGRKGRGRNSMLTYDFQFVGVRMRPGGLGGLISHGSRKVNIEPSGSLIGLDDAGYSKELKYRRTFAPRTDGLQLAQMNCSLSLSLFPPLLSLAPALCVPNTLPRPLLCTRQLPTTALPLSLPPSSTFLRFLFHSRMLLVSSPLSAPLRSGHSEDVCEQAGRIL